MKKSIVTVKTLHNDSEPAAFVFDTLNSATSLFNILNNTNVKEPTEIELVGDDGKLLVSSIKRPLK